MNFEKRHIATNTLCLLIVSLCAGPAFAGVAVGTVTLVSGPLLVKKENGALKALGLNSSVEQGDVLVSEKATYARIKFADDSEITLKPNTQLKVEAFSFNPDVLDNGDTLFSVSQGAVQVKTGTANKHGGGNMKLVMPTLHNSMASITVKREPGTTFIAEYVPELASQLAVADARHLGDSFRPVRWRTREPETSNSRLTSFMGSSLLPKLTWRPFGYLAAAGGFDLPLDRRGSFAPLISALTHSLASTAGSRLSWPTNRAEKLQLAQIRTPIPSSTPALPPGLYVQVVDGLINVTNKGGTQNFTSGQFGYTSSINKPPVVVPANPGLQFSPPPSFSAPPSGPGTQPKSDAVSCIVR